MDRARRIGSLADVHLGPALALGASAVPPNAFGTESNNLAISESGLRMQSKHTDSQLAWAAFIGWREAKSVFVIFPQPRTYVPIPKRAFTEQQQVEFRETLRRNVLPFKG